MGLQDQLWAPWRLAYIQPTEEETAEKQAREETSAALEYPPGADPECFICQAAADSADRERHVVARGERTIVILNRYPYNNGHLLVAPIEHLARLDEIPTETHTALMLEVTRWTRIMEKAMEAQGFNVGLNLGRVAGAGLPGHLHWHIVPRWNGDTNFMPALSGVKVIPQSLDALWQILVDAAEKEPR